MNISGFVYLKAIETLITVSACLVESIFCTYVFLLFCTINMCTSNNFVPADVCLQASPESLYSQKAQNLLCPSHTYAYVSGGDPLAILDLTVSYFTLVDR